MALHTLEICSGVGMLGEGLRAGLQYMGVETRTVCHIEREAYAAAVLAARMEEGSMDPAPVWSDLLTFDAAAWRGAVDCIVAGFPCQDLSVAGRRVGLDGSRSGLFFDVLRIARDCGAPFLALENVAGIASAVASVVDEEEGELEERAAARVLGELADNGWDAEWITLSAAAVGAAHGRARWFCLAWRELADAGRVQCGAGHGEDQSGSPEAAEQQSDDWVTNSGQNVADATRHGRHGQNGQAGHGRRVCETSYDLGDSGLQHQHLQQRTDGSPRPAPQVHRQRRCGGTGCGRIC